MCMGVKEQQAVVYFGNAAWVAMNRRNHGRVINYSNAILRLLHEIAVDCELRVEALMCWHNFKACEEYLNLK